MSKTTYLIISIFLIFMALAGIFIWSRNIAEAPTKSLENQEQKELAPVPENPPEPVPNKIYPISGFLERKIVNPFGRYFPPGGKHPDSEICPNSVNYVGYHTALDIETSASEVNANVPVLSIADGIIRQRSNISGYGGLVIIEYVLAGQYYTAYYGHLDLSTVKLVLGDKINAGERIGNLGAACTSDNGVTRKHLHLGLHKGKEIDIRGYVSSRDALSDWVDPINFL